MPSLIANAAKGAGGAIAQIIELRGRLTFVGPLCFSESTNVPFTRLNRREPDWHYNLELDPAWLDHLAVKHPNLIVRPGNVIDSATRLARPGVTTPQRFKRLSHLTLNAPSSDTHHRPGWPRIGYQNTPHVRSHAPQRTAKRPLLVQSRLTQGAGRPTEEVAARRSLL